MALRIENRLERLERALDINGDQDRPFELDFGGGVRFTTTDREFGQILREIEGTRILPGNTARVRPPADEAEPAELPEGLTDDDGI